MCNGLIPFGMSHVPSLFDDFGFPKMNLREFFELDPNLVKSDIKETDSSYIVEAELPGFKKEDIQVSMENGVLSISAQTNSETENKKDNYVRKESVSGKVSRIYHFENIDENGVKAKYDSGVLSVELPKVERTVEKKGIEIE